MSFRVEESEGERKTFQDNKRRHMVLSFMYIFKTSCV